MRTEKSLIKIIDIEQLGFDSGAHILIKRALQQNPQDQELAVTGSAKEWQVQLSAWCRSQGHSLHFAEISEKSVGLIKANTADLVHWNNTIPKDKTDSDFISEEALPFWGLAARGAQVEVGSPEFQFRLRHKVDVWSDNAAELYAHAVAAQWNPETAIDWSAPQNHESELEAALVQILTYMIENENAALIIPARFLGQLHPHYREVQALLAIQINDEARHIQVFTRRIHLYGYQPTLSTAGGQASLKTLLDESDFSIAGLLLSVLGEGTFIDLLQFLHRFAPDVASRQMALLAARDEARHVSFGMSHLLQHLQKEPELRHRLKRAIEARHEGLAQTSGLNAEVFDSLIILAAGGLAPAAIAQGYRHVQSLMLEMAAGRSARLTRLGFTEKESQQLSSLHTRNFM